MQIDAASLAANVENCGIVGRRRSESCGRPATHQCLCTLVSVAAKRREVPRGAHTDFQLRFAVLKAPAAHWRRPRELVVGAADMIMAKLLGSQLGWSVTVEVLLVAVSSKIASAQSFATAHL